MDKYQEALNRLKTAPSFMGGTLEYKAHLNSEELLMKDVNTLQQLVDKETPKKYKIKTDKDGRMIYVCPNCGDILVKFWSEVETISCRPYCDNCGQHLDWNDEDE